MEETTATTARLDAIEKHLAQLVAQEKTPRLTQVIGVRIPMNDMMNLMLAIGVSAVFMALLFGGCLLILVMMASPILQALTR